MTLHARARVDVRVVAPHRVRHRERSSPPEETRRRAHDVPRTTRERHRGHRDDECEGKPERHSRTRACDRRRHRRGGAFTRVHSRRLATRPRPHPRARRCDSWHSHARRHVSRSQTRRARLPKHPKNKHAAGNCCYTARTVPVRASSSSTRSEARVVTRVLNQIRPSSPCLRTRIRNPVVFSMFTSRVVTGRF